jgi:hypothetical protein
MRRLIPGIIIVLLIAGGGSWFNLVTLTEAKAETIYGGTSNLEIGPWARLGQKRPSAKDVSKPYHYASLKNMANEDLVRYMGKGKNMSELDLAKVIITHIPTNFWSLDPKSAALTTANENRYPDNQKRFRLEVNDRDGQKAPDICSISFTDASDKSYNAVDSHYFLRVDPNKSYLAYAQSWSGGMVFYNFVHDQPTFDFRYCELPYGEARHLAHTIWWLNRVHSLSDASIHGGIFSGSSADGRGSLTIRSDRGDVIIKLSETLWADHVSERWRAEYDQKVCLNLASFLISDALTMHLGDRWSRFKPPHHLPSFLAGLTCETNSPQNEQDHRKNIQALTGTFLDLFSPDQRLISFAIVRESVRAAGSFVYTNLSTKLADIQSQLPTVSAPKRTKGEIEAEIKRLDGIKSDDKGWQDAMNQKAVLYKELTALNHDTGADSSQALRDSISLSLKKIQCADDLPALQSWASSKEPGFQWALQRLKDKDRKRYVAALEWWMKNTKENWVRQAYAAIAKEDSSRAVEIAKEIPPEKKGYLTVSAFSHLAEVDGIPDEKKRVEALIQVALDPKSGFQERGKAIELLVPHDQPLRYPTPDIDAALVQLFSPELADAYYNITLACACRALARRGKTEYFDKMVETLERTEDGTVYSGVLGAVTQLAQCDPAKYNPRLLAILQQQLKRTNKKVPDLMMAAWSADLRELKPDLESIATSGPGDYEDERANSHGGAVRDVDGRFHLARKIVALWNEEDLLTRCRLLFIFGLKEACDYWEFERTARIKSELTKTVQVLIPEQRKQMIVFLEWYQGVKKYKEDSVGGEFIAMTKNLLNKQ